MWDYFASRLSTDEGAKKYVAWIGFYQFLAFVVYCVWRIV